MNIDDFSDINDWTIRSKDLIIGPPGSGKTHYLIQNLIEIMNNRRANPLILSFTRAAVQEIKKRVLKENKDLLAPFFNLNIMTFDQFSARLISNNKNLQEHYHLSDYEITIRHATELIKKGTLELYNKEIASLREDSLINQISHIFIDEVQDLQGIRAELIAALFIYLEKHNQEWGFTLLGDMNQEIYSFQDNTDTRFPRSKDFIDHVQNSYRDTLNKWIVIPDFERNPRYENLDENIKGRIKLMLKLLREGGFQGIDLARIKSSMPIITIGNDGDLRNEMGKYFQSSNDTSILFRKNKSAIEFALWVLLLGKRVQYLLGNDEIIIPPWISYILTRDNILETNKKGYKVIIQKYAFFNSNDIEMNILDKFSIDRQTAWKYLSLFSGNGENFEKIDTNRIYDNISRKRKELLLREAGREGGNLVVSTIHKAKGREYKNVIIDDFIVKNQEKNELYEQARIFYVALTRACRSVKLLHYGNEQYRRNKKMRTRTFKPRNRLTQNNEIRLWITDTKWFDPKSTLGENHEEANRIQNYIVQNLDIGDQVIIEIKRKDSGKIVSSVLHRKGFTKIGEMTSMFTLKMLRILSHYCRGKPEDYIWWLGGLLIVSLNTEILPVNDDSKSIPFLYRQKKFWLGFRVLGPLYISNKEYKY